MLQPVRQVPLRSSKDPVRGRAHLVEVRLTRLDLQRNEPTGRHIVDRDLNNRVDAPIGLVLLSDLPAQRINDQRRDAVNAYPLDPIGGRTHGTHGSWRRDRWQR
jgi:hypothetical protein